MGRMGFGPIAAWSILDRTTRNQSDHRPLFEVLANLSWAVVYGTLPIGRNNFGKNASTYYRLDAPSFAKKVLELRADNDLLARIGELRSKANQGMLSLKEETEYKEYVEAIDIIALLQQKARQALQPAGE